MLSIELCYILNTVRRPHPAKEMKSVKVFKVFESFLEITLDLFPAALTASFEMSAHINWSWFIFLLNVVLNGYFIHLSTLWKVHSILLKWILKKPQVICLDTFDERQIFYWVMFKTRGVFSHFLFLLSYFFLLWLCLCIVKRRLLCFILTNGSCICSGVWPLERRRLYYQAMEGCRLDDLLEEEKVVRREFHRYMRKIIFWSWKQRHILFVKKEHISHISLLKY